MSRPWLQELLRVLVYALSLLLAGWLIGHIALVLLVGLLFYFGWHLWQLFRLHRWLQQGRKFEPPDARGIWGEVFYNVYRLQRRNRKRKQRLTALLERFRRSAAALPDATVILDDEWRIEWSNEAARELLNLHRTDVGQRIDNLIRHPRFCNQVAQGSLGEPIEIPAPGDERVIASLAIVPYGKGQYLLIGRDVTRLRRLEQMRRDFIANVSHELRTPLTVVLGFLETMRDSEGGCGEEWRRELELMQQQATRMQRLVEDIMLLSRLETSNGGPSHETVHVPALLAAIREEAQLLSGSRNHRISLECTPGLDIVGSAEELRSAFSNLVFNAVKYTPDEGEVRIVWTVDAEAPVLRVEDSGIGIEAHHIPQLTERFYRVDVARSRETGGTGLGLAIVKHVLNRHGARLEIASIPGKGSSFTCRFPAGKAASAS